MWPLHFQALILKITYENFKNVVKARQGIKRAEIYHNVWRELCEIEYLPTLPRAYGGLLIDADGRVLLCKPRGEYDGYVWTFPKGRPETGEADTECALREVREETGYQAQITGKIFGSYESESSATEYFLMHPVGTPENFGPETEAICWVTLDEARQKVQETRNVAGQKRDLSVLKQLLEMK